MACALPESLDIGPAVPLFPGLRLPAAAQPAPLREWLGNA